MDFSLWLAFFAASWAISISPGAGAVAAMSAGVNHGFARGYFMTFGLVLGIWTQVLVVGLGLGALIAASSLGCGWASSSGARPPSRWWRRPARRRRRGHRWCCAAGW